MIFYFSGSGNSRYIAEQLAQRTNDIALPVCELWLEESLDIPFAWAKNEAVGFVFPVHAWGPPLFVLRALKRMQTTQPVSIPYLYMVCTCGDDTGHTERIFRRVLHGKGWPLHAAFSIAMPNTYVCLPGFDVDAPAVEAGKLRQAMPRIEQVASIVRKRQTGVSQMHLGRFPWLKTYVVRPLFNRFLTKEGPFHTTDACNGCGVCTRECHANNIRLDNRQRPEWLGQCTGCLRCYHSCPQHAIRYGRFTEGKGQYLLQQALRKCPTVPPRK